jgi:hypothetical protein
LAAGEGAEDSELFGENAGRKILKNSMAVCLSGGSYGMVKGYGFLIDCNALLMAI